MNRPVSEKVTVTFTRKQWEDITACIEAVSKMKARVRESEYTKGYVDTSDVNYFLKLARKINPSGIKKPVGAEVINMAAFR